MYRCTICNKEYETKPDFCDCGNDEFESFNIEKKETKQSQNVKQEIQYKSNKKMEKGDIISIVIFSVCVLFSLWFLLFFGGGGNKIENAPENKTIINETKTIPDINTIWDDTPNKTEIDKPIQTAPVKKEEAKPLVSQKKQKPLPQKQLPQKPKLSNKIAPLAQPPVYQAAKPAQTQTPRQIVSVKQPTVDIEAQKQELKTYKIALRNKIAQGINFASVAGDGKCSVTFSVSNTGALVGRKFSQLSENDMLNQAVFRAVSNVTSFYPPPALYKGETLTLTVSFFDGNFSVTLP